MHTRFTRFAVVVAVTAGFSTSAFAITPQNIRISDGVFFTPTLQIEERHDDNIFAAEKKRKSSWVTVIEPSFALSLDRAKSAYQLKYSLSSKSFHSISSNNYIDHHLTADTGFEFNSRNRLLLNAGYHKLQDTATDQSYTGDKPKNDKWNTKNIGGIYTYGARTARAQIDLGLNYDELRYDNNSNKSSDRDAVSGVVTGYYAITPKTKLLLEGRYTDYGYKNDKERDSANKALLAGMTWEATAKTTGTVKIGREKKDYKNSSTNYKDTSTGMWEAGVTWAPRTYSTFTLQTRRGFDEGNYTDFDNVDPFGDTELVTSTSKTVETSLGWKHYWMEHLYSDAEYRRIDRKYQNVKRDDKIDQYGLGLTYEMRRWLDIGIGFTHRENDSDVKNNSYKRNIYALTFNISL